MMGFTHPTEVGSDMSWIFQFTEHWKHQEGVANAFGVILYTDKHPNIKKILMDNDYWAALDEMSGPKWAVFSIRAKSGHYTIPSFPAGTMGLMIPVWKEPSENELLLESFEIESTEKLPQLLVFAQGENGEILKHSIRLDDSSPEKAYNTLMTGIKIIAKAIEDISPENLKNPEGVYAAISLSISNHEQWQVIKKGILFCKWMVELLSLFKTTS